MYYNRHTGVYNLVYSPGIVQGEIDAAMGTVIAIDTTAEGSSPGRIMKADTISGFIRHPIVDKGIIFYHCMIGSLVGNLVNTGGGCMSCGHVSCDAVGLHTDFVINHNINSLS